jgi:hypothetical protein
VIELPEQIEFEDAPIEKKYRSVTAGLVRRIKILYDAIYQRYGRDGLDLIREASEKYGMEIAERARRGLVSDDIQSVALYVVKIFNTIGGEGRVIEFSKERVIIRIYQCPYPWEDPRVCKAHTAMEKTVVETLGKNLTYSIPRSIPRGDLYCDHVIEYKHRGPP